MKVLYLDWPCFGQENIKFYFRQRGMEIVTFFHDDFLGRESNDFLERGRQCVRQACQDGKNFDFCFSYNYFPLMAKLCHEENIKYISFVYDNPQTKLYSKTVRYKTNYIFCFDSAAVEEFRNSGFSNFFYMPLPVNSRIIDQMLKFPYDQEKCCCEVSFVGMLYNEEHNFYEELEGISENCRKYIDQLIEGQICNYRGRPSLAEEAALAYLKDRPSLAEEAALSCFKSETGENELSNLSYLKSKTSGNNEMGACKSLGKFSRLEAGLNKQIIDEIQNVIQYVPDKDGTESAEYVIANYILARRLTYLERKRLLEKASEKFKVKLFTRDADAVVGKCQNMGIADYYGELPYICHESKVNLNLTLRSIGTGIPLRAMDILGYGGFLLTNYQADFEKHFVDGQDYVAFENEEDMLAKIDYYLSHDREREEIAQSGHDKVVKHHDMFVIMDKILDMVL